MSQPYKIKYGFFFISSPIEFFGRYFQEAWLIFMLLTKTKLIGINCAEEDIKALFKYK